MTVVDDALPSPQQLLLAARIQSLFKGDGLTLADPRTAEVYRTTLKAVRLILAGAVATDVLDADGHAIIADMVDAAEAVPEVL